jgi:CubicO group peptidase (beta-lactamase class C family)
MKKIILLLLLSAVLVSCGDTRKSVPDATQMACQNAVDASLSAATYKAGVSVAVCSGKYNPWTYAAGKASESAAMSTSSPAFAFSITKTVLSALILKQIENSLYTLDDSVGNLLSSADVTAINNLSNCNGINLNATVAELLTHTSGMMDYATNTGVNTSLVENLGVSTNVWNPLQILALVPGSLGTVGDYNYASTNYILLGMIAEYQADKPLNTLLSGTFFTALGITAVLAPQDQIPADIVSPYDQYALASLFSSNIEAEYPELMTMYGDLGSGVSLADYVLDLSVNLNLLTGSAAWAAGGIIATADNLAKWGYELYSSQGTAVSAAERTQLLNSAPDGGDYGYGVEKTSFTYSDGTAGSFYGHSGDGPGGKTILAYDPDLDMSVAVILNASADYTALTTNLTSDAALGLVDRKELVETIFRAFKAENTNSP